MAPKPPPMPKPPEFTTGLSLSQKERLALLIEECGETIQAATKILRHGYDSYNPFDAHRVTNRAQLAKEIGHIGVAVELLANERDIEVALVNTEADTKRMTVWQWLHFQRPPKTRSQ